MREDLLRSVVRCRPTDSAVLVGKNITVVRDARVEFLLPEDAEIWAAVDKFHRDHGHPPELQTVLGLLRASSQVSAADRMEAILGEPLRTEGDFLHIVEQVCEERRIRILDQACRDARLIAGGGLEVGEGRKKQRLQGSQQAAAYVVDAMREVSAPTLSSSLSGEVLEGADDLGEEYKRIESDPRAAFGQWTGIKQLDDSLGGARIAELWVHAAYTGHLKTTLALNWAYNQSIGFHENVLYFSLEMPYRQVRRWIVAMHSMHSKFAEVRIALGLQSGPTDAVGLDYKSIRDAQLNPAERTFLLDHVIPDLKDARNGYGRIFIEVADANKVDIPVSDLRARAESLYSRVPFGMAFVDHASLLGIRSKHTSTSDRLNEALLELKQFALNFRRGQGLPVMALFQINRDGLREAQKRKDKGHLPTYELYNLSYASEAERSADVVTATYLDKEYAQRGRALLTCLKSRDNAPFDPCLLEVKWACRRMRTCLESPMVDASTQVGPDDADVVAALDSIK